MCCLVTALPLLCSGTPTDLWQCTPPITKLKHFLWVNIEVRVCTYGVWVGGGGGGGEYCNQGNHAYQTLNLSQDKASMTVVCVT